MLFCLHTHTAFYSRSISIHVLRVHGIQPRMPQRLHLQNRMSNWISAKLSLCSFYTEAARLSRRLWDFELDTVAATATIATISSFETWQGDVSMGKAKEESSSLTGRTIITDAHWRKRSRRGSAHKSSTAAWGGGMGGGGMTRQPNTTGTSKEKQTFYMYYRSDYQEVLLFYPPFLLKFALVSIFFFCGTAPSKIQSLVICVISA